jgi:hypothetical protein
VINRLSSVWELDSTGNSGFRLNNCNYILSSKQGNFTKEFLLEKFGKPNEMIKISGGTECAFITITTLEYFLKTKRDQEPVLM